MNVRLGTLDMVVKVIAKNVNQVDCIIFWCLARVPRKKNERNVTNIISRARVGIHQLARRLSVREENLMMIEQQ